MFFAFPETIALPLSAPLYRIEKFISLSSVKDVVFHNYRFPIRVERKICRGMWVTIWYIAPTYMWWF